MNIIERTFGEKLEWQLKLRGITKSELARQLNVSRQSVQCWTNDRKMPSVPHIVYLLNILKRADTLPEYDKLINNPNTCVEYHLDWEQIMEEILARQRWILEQKRAELLAKLPPSDL